MIEAIFFAVPRNAELNSGLSFSVRLQTVHRWRVSSGGRLVFVLSPSDISCGSHQQFRINHGSEENEIVEKRNQDRGFCAQGTQEQFKDKGRQAHESKPFDF